MTIKGMLRNIFKYGKIRSLLTMSGVAVGMFSVVLISAIGSVGTAEVGNTLMSMGVDTLLVQTADNSVSVRLTDKELSLARTVEGVADAMPLMASTSEIKMIGRRLDCFVWGVDKSADKLISLEALYGRLINSFDTSSKAKVCVIDEKFALETYGRSNITGKKVQVFLGGKYHEFEVVGIAKSGLTALQGMLSNVVPSFIYLPITTMQSLCGRHTYDKIAVKLSNPNEFSPSAVTKLLDRENGITDGFVCNNLLSQKEQLEDIMHVVTAALSLVAGISLAVAGISVMTTMMMSVSERTREIGIKKAIGAKNSDICREFLCESILLTVMGSAAGIVSGLAVAFIGCLLTGAEFTADISALLISAVSSAGIGAVFGVIPAVKAARLSPAEALRM